MAPGAKFSTSTSAPAMSRRSTSLPPVVFRSSTMPRLLRFIIRKEAASSPIFGGTEWRVSSPFGDFSILMTSAPMSASISVQVGPAMTWVRSTTFRPASGPGRWPAELDLSFCIGMPLLAAPLRRALAEKRIEPFAEIRAGVGHQDQVLALISRQPLLQASDRLLGRVERQWRVAGDEFRYFVGARVERGEILDDFGEEADGGGFRGFHEPCGEDQILDARRADQRGEAADIGHRQAVAQRAGDGKSHPRGFGADPKVAAHGNCRAAAGAGAGDRRDGRHPASLEGGEDPVDAVL